MCRSSLRYHTEHYVSFDPITVYSSASILPVSDYPWLTWQSDTGERQAVRKIKILVIVVSPLDQLDRLEEQDLSRSEKLQTATLDIARLQNNAALAETTITGLRQSLATKQGEQGDTQ